MNFNTHLPSFRLILVTLVVSLVGCNTQSSQVTSPTQTRSAPTQVENSLTFNNISLEQTNARGQKVWNVVAKQAIYSQDKKIARVINPTGELYEDGRVAYKISAATGEIQQDGKALFLQGQIVATDPQNGIVLHGNDLEWRPNEALLIVRNQLTGTHKQLQVTAQEARVFSRLARMELLGQVVANAADPGVQLQTQHLIWQIREQKLVGDRPLQINRFQGKAITDRAAANQGEFDLKTKIATLQQHVQLFLLDPQMQITSDNISWNLPAQTITANQPIQAVDREHQLTVSANQGRMDLQQKVVYLTGNVTSVGERGQYLNSSQLTWYVPTQQFEAEGNVVYHQIDPPMNFTGQKAVGQLAQQSVVVSGGGVVTQFIPNENR